MQKKLYSIFDEKERKTLGVYSPAEAEVEIGIPKEKVNTYAINCSSFKGRYLIKEIHKESLQELKTEWDEIRLKFLK